jgi:hypothetical protein
VKKRGIKMPLDCMITHSRDRTHPEDPAHKLATNTQYNYFRGSLFIGSDLGPIPWIWAVRFPQPVGDTIALKITCGRGPIFPAFPR